MLLSWQSHLFALWVRIKNRSPLESSEAKCQLVCKTQNSRRVNNCISSWGDSLALHCLLGLGRMTSPPDNIDGSPFWATSLLGSAWVKTLGIQRIPFLEASSLSKNSSRELYFVVCVHLPSNSYVALGIHWLAKKPTTNQAFVLASDSSTSQLPPF